MSMEAKEKNFENDVESYPLSIRICNADVMSISI